MMYLKLIFNHSRTSSPVPGYSQIIGTTEGPLEGKNVRLARPCQCNPRNVSLLAGVPCTDVVELAEDGHLLIDPTIGCVVRQPQRIEIVNLAADLLLSLDINGEMNRGEGAIS